MFGAGPELPYEGVVIRPPSEASSLILQATFGCSHNRCTFCPTYKDTRFRIKPLERFQAEVERAAAWGTWRRVFLCDGDALILPQAMLLERLTLLRTTLPGLQRVGIYANGKALERKSLEDLLALRELGLGIIYYGLESGDDPTLERICKGRSAARLVAAGRKAREAGIALSVTVLLGIAGVDDSLRHAVATGEALSAIDPDYVGALTVMVVPGTALAEAQARGEFVLPDRFALLEELAVMLSRTDLSSGLFLANHASNYLPLKLVLPRDKERGLALLKQVLDERDESRLKPEWLRGL